MRQSDDASNRRLYYAALCIIDFDRSIVAFCGQIVINKYKYIVRPLIIDIFLNSVFFIFFFYFYRIIIKVIAITSVGGNYNIALLVTFSWKVMCHVTFAIECTLQKE